MAGTNPATIYVDLPDGILYTLDQPPILLAAVGAFILGRSRSR